MQWNVTVTLELQDCNTQVSEPVNMMGEKIPVKLTWQPEGKYPIKSNQSKKELSCDKSEKILKK